MSLSYSEIVTAVGPVGFWWDMTDVPRLHRIILGGEAGNYPANGAAERAPTKSLEIWGKYLFDAWITGRPGASDPEISQKDLTEFQIRVLQECRRIPRGRVCTYGSLAVKAGQPGGARAIGQVMAANPFPLLIPCHRVIRSDGRPGNYGGGNEMKIRLLALEGIELDQAGRVPWHYFI